MTITASTSAAQESQRTAYFRHFDDAGTPAAATFYPGFKPREVIAINLTDRIRYEWYYGMAQGDYIKRIANGTETIATDDKLIVEVDNGQRPSVTLAASEIPQNKQFEIIVRS